MTPHDTPHEPDQRRHDRAVTPVISIILLTAIVIGTGIFTVSVALTAFGQYDTTNPDPTYTYDYNPDDDTLTVTHAGGDSIPASASVNVYVNNDTDPGALNAHLFTNGDTITITGIEPGDDIRIEWVYTDSHGTLDTHHVTDTASET